MRLVPREEEVAMDIFILLLGAIRARGLAIQQSLVQQAADEDPPAFEDLAEVGQVLDGEMIEEDEVRFVGIDRRLPGLQWLQVAGDAPFREVVGDQRIAHQVTILQIDIDYGTVLRHECETNSVEFSMI